VSLLEDGVDGPAQAVVEAVGVDAILITTRTSLNGVTLVHIFALVLVPATVISFLASTTVTSNLVIAEVLATTVTVVTLVDVFAVRSIDGFVTVGSAPALETMARVTAEDVIIRA
jgi:uncharacterized protein (DUF983 family)